MSLRQTRGSKPNTQRTPHRGYVWWSNGRKPSGKRSRRIRMALTSSRSASISFRTRPQDHCVIFSGWRHRIREDHQWLYRVRRRSGCTFDLWSLCRKCHFFSDGPWEGNHGKQSECHCNDTGSSMHKWMLTSIGQPPFLAQQRGKVRVKGTAPIPY